MKNKVTLWVKKHPAIIILAVIFLVGTFLRSYHFSDWLHFELDQSRDAKVIDLAIEEGASNLPLLGPKAAGSFLRLGPAFYYLQYLSAEIFGNTPAGMVVISLILSCLTILVFYFFLKRYFKENLALGLTLLFSTSLFFIMYSRFGWNPNNMPFFILTGFYALLKMGDKEEKNKGGIWTIIFFFALGIATQLHFMALMSIPLVSLLFLLWKRPRIKLKFWLIGIFIFLTLYIPPIVNDIKTGGDNIKEFIRVFNKESIDEDHTPLEKLYRNFTENSLGYFIMLSGYEKGELPKLNQKSGFKLDLKCDQGCRDNLKTGALALGLMSAGILALAWRFKESLKETSPQKDFIILTCLWFIITFGLFFPVAYDIAPRFFLLISALPFILLGLVLEKINKFISNRKLGLVIVLIIIGILAISNLFFTQKRFSEMSNSLTNAFKISTDRILKERTRVTLKQQLAITDYIESKYKANGYAIYLNSDPYFRRSFLYHLEQREIPRDDFRNNKQVYQKGNYFLIYPTTSNLQDATYKYLEEYNITETKEFGTLTVFYLAPKSEAVTAIEQEFEPKGKPKSAPGVPVRFRWEEVFSDSSDDEEGIE